MDRENSTIKVKEKTIIRTTALALMTFACIHLIWRLCNYSECFTEVEVFSNWLPSVLQNGRAFSLSDFRLALDAWGMDGDSRPRFLSYYLAAITLKTRIAMWDWLPPHPSFSPLWPITLLLAPWLLYKFLREELNCCWSALTGAGLYMLTAGYLSSATMLFHPAKPLANVVVIVTLYLAMQARKSLPAELSVPVEIIPRTVIIFYLAVLPLLLMADETALFSLLILPVWADRYVIPRRIEKACVKPCLVNSFILAFPAIVYLIVAFIIAPLLCNTFLHRAYSFAGYLERYQDVGKTGVASLVQHFTTLFTAVFAPWQWLHFQMPITVQPKLPTAMFIAMLSLYILLLTAGYRDKKRRSLLLRLAILLSLFFLFQTYVASHHPMNLTVTGYYYGAIFSVLISILISVAIASIAGTKFGQIAVIFFVFSIATIQSINFTKLNNSWLEHRNRKVMSWLDMATYNPFIASADISKISNLQAPTGDYASDVPSDVRLKRFNLSLSLWRFRENNPCKFLKGHILALEDLWILSELYYRRVPSDMPTFLSSTSTLPISINNKLLNTYRTALQQARYGQPDEIPLPLLAFQNIVHPDNDTFGAETRLAYPWFLSEIPTLLMYLREKGYSHILITDRKFNQSTSYGALHERFMQETKGGGLKQYGILTIGNFMLDGHSVTLLEIL